MSPKSFIRKCPTCQVDLFYSTCRHRNQASKLNSLCRECARRTSIHKPKEEFTCIVCGKQWIEWRSQLSNPDTPCCSKQCWQQHGTKSLVGQRFAQLLVCDRKRRGQTTFYECLCDCGNHTEVTHTNLVSGSTSSCGCLITETRGSERKPLKEVVTKAILTSYKRNARNRHYELLLPYDKFVELINGNCYYCGSGPSNTFTWHYKYETATMPFNGIDRIDNTIGYTIDNCVSCCRTCNSAKGELTLDQFKEWALRLVARFQ
jgi:hypothetical protein